MRPAETISWMDSRQACDRLFIALALPLRATRVGKDAGLELAVANAAEELVTVWGERFLREDGCGESKEKG